MVHCLGVARDDVRRELFRRQAASRGVVIPEVGNDLVAGRVDGTYADNEMAVRALLGPASYRVAAASFLTNAGPPSASTYVRTMSGGRNPPACHDAGWPGYGNPDA